jgi:hypothetical protein
MKNGLKNEKWWQSYTTSVQLKTVWIFYKPSYTNNIITSQISKDFDYQKYHKQIDKKKRFTGFSGSLFKINQTHQILQGP